MYTALLLAHSVIRWLVVASLTIAIVRAYRALATNAPFSTTDNTIRHWTATFTHIQLMVGYALYFTSPLIKAFYDNKHHGLRNSTLTFFSVIHLLLMTTAIIIITIGSARAKRQSTDHAKHKTVLTWFITGFVIIFVAIPWPFSPLAQRPWLHNFTTPSTTIPYPQKNNLPQSLNPNPLIPNPPTPCPTPSHASAFSATSKAHPC